MAKNITNFTENVNNVQALDDRPNASGMSSETLKATFDKAGSDIKTYINGTLIPEIEQAFDNTDSEFENYVLNNDPRLSNSRQCNNNFDNPITARENLKIKTGTSLPETVEDGCLFFLYS